MSRFWNQKTKNLDPYIPGEQPRAEESVIKLNTNENPYPPSPAVRDCIRNFEPDLLKKYPDYESKDLREAIASFHGITADNVFIGNGSDEVLAFSFQAFFERGKDARPLSVPDISYGFYPVYIKAYDIPARVVGLREDFSIDTEVFLQPSGGVVLANPNAPTGIAEKPEDILKIVESDPDRVVLVDEAYVGFGTDSLAEYTKRFDNLLIVGTMSKSRSLAGLRLGWAIGSPELMEGLRRVRDSFNSYPVDSLTQQIAKVAFADTKWYDRTRREIMESREMTSDALKKMGFFVLESKTNFLFVRPKTIPALQLCKSLKEKGILVRYFSGPRIDAFLRITIGSREQMQTLLYEIEEILKDR